jgi:YVTN family beta-propeller protein
VFNLKSLKVLGRVTVGKRPDAIIYDAASNRVFTFNSGSQDATAIDASTLKVLGSVPMGGKPEFPTVDGRGNLFVNIEDKSEILTFNTRTLAIKHTWSIAPGEEPSGMAIDSRHHRLFSVCHNGMMVVMNADNGKVVATPAIGKGPDAATFDPGKELAFSSNGQDGTLTVVREISPEKFAVVDTVPTQTSARTMAIDPKHHRIYLAAATMQAPPATTESTPAAGTPPPRYRMSMVKDSFVILVVGR